MTWWTAALGGLLGGRGFLVKVVDWCDNAGRRKLIQHTLDSHGPDDAIKIARAMAIAEGHSNVGDLVHSSTELPIQATAEREQPKAIEPPKSAPPDISAAPVPPDNLAEPPP